MIPGALVFAMMVGCGKTYTPEEEVRTAELPAGTELFVTPTEPLQMDQLDPGDPFEGVLTEPITMDGTVVAPKGSPVSGEIVHDPQAEGEDYLPLGVRLNSMTVHGGEEAILDTAPVFPQPSEEEEGEEPEVRESAVLRFVLQQPAQLSWTMDVSRLDPDKL